MQVISLGLGVQSTALYYMSSMGMLPRADYAVFADTGGERTATLRYLHEILLPWAKANNGVPLLIIRERDLEADLLAVTNSCGNRFASIPAFIAHETGETGMLRRQCTYEYKVTQVNKCIRQQIYGLKKRQPMPTTSIWKGITTDEIERLRYPDTQRQIFTYPFVKFSTSFSKGKNTFERLDWGEIMSRTAVTGWYKENRLPIPPKSACLFCPYTNDAGWWHMKHHEPEDFARAVAVDEAVRDSTAKGIKKPAYLHESCRPLAAIDFKQSDDKIKYECSDNCHL